MEVSNVFNNIVTGFGVFYDHRGIKLETLELTNNFLAKIKVVNGGVLSIYYSVIGKVIIFGNNIYITYEEDSEALRVTLSNDIELIKNRFDGYTQNSYCELHKYVGHCITACENKEEKSYVKSLTAGNRMRIGVYVDIRIEKCGVEVTIRSGFSYTKDVKFRIPVQMGGLYELHRVYKV